MINKAPDKQQAVLAAFKDAKPPKIVRVVGDLNSIIADNKRFYRHDRIHIPDMGNILCASYDNQFIFRDTRKLGWTLFCSCGSVAVVVGYDAYKKDASAGPEMLVCYAHAGGNRHADGST
jgi:hypothetical protein